MNVQDTSNALVSIVGLLINFINERRHSSRQDYDEFMQWLKDHQHERLLKLIEQNLATTTSIKVILTGDRTRLERIDQNIERMARKLEALPD